MRVIDLDKIRERNEFRKPRDSDVIDGFMASQEIAALVDEIERLRAELPPKFCVKCGDDIYSSALAETT